MPTDPLCTVVVPTYNRMESLKQTLDGLQIQTIDLAQFEVVVVSDGSTDGTPEFLQDYAKSSSLNLRWFQQKNQGPATARNFGVNKASAEIVVLLDDDVVPIPEFLELHLRHHNEIPNAVVIAPMSPDPLYGKREPAWIAWEHAKLQDIYALFLPGGQYFGHDMGPMHFYSGNASLRRDLLLGVGGFNTAFTRQEDVEFAERLRAAHDVRFIFDPEAVGQHHPVRSLASWLRIPTSYGQFDAERVRSGALSMDRVSEIHHERHGATKKLADICATSPIALAAATWVLTHLSSLLYTFGARRPALAALSAIYNARYTAAFASGMGHSPKLKQRTA